MEVLYMAENELSKAELWIKRIQDFYSSGLSRKAWCQEHQISLSTFSYWLKKQTEPTETESELEPVFARLPSQRELSCDLSASHAPVIIHLTGSVWIEIGAGCPGELLASLLHALKTYAWSGRHNNRLSCMRSDRPAQKLPGAGGHHKTEIPSRSVFTLYVCLL